MFLGGAAHAADATALAQKDGCLACHSVDKKVVGPAFKDVAKKYAGNKGAEAMLLKKVKEGGSGTWGAIPMPPNGPRVSDADIKTLVDWVLSLK
ncbi:MAG TPA: c-type cytochrome [Noviherbaspirillum sp.]|nr:c-type cytochrome [Noviherbaspirillum sp.]HJV84289.1 c-type cytochrome [Noviherbaspirillum sp.]